MWKIEKLPYMGIIKNRHQTKTGIGRKAYNRKDYLKQQTKSRAKCKRRARVIHKEFRGYRNGCSSRTIGLVGGETEIKMPLVSNSGESFESKILPPYLRTTPAVLNTFPQLYLYGLSSGDFREH